jgi:hypothetical protein
MTSITLASSNLLQRNPSSFAAPGGQGRGEVAAPAFVRAKFVTRPSTFAALLCLLAFALLLPAPKARAWDKGGHMIVAQVAYMRLNSTARAKVDALAAQIKDSHNAPYNFVNLAAWMDDIKSDPGPHHGDYKPWHYLDIGCDAGDPDPLVSPPFMTLTNGDVVTALTRARKVAQGQTDPLIDDAPTALAMLVHLVGDIHQPLHTASRYHHPLTTPPTHEEGGNLIPIATAGEAHKLHAFWDDVYRFWYSAGTIKSNPQLGHDTAPNTADVKAWAKKVKTALPASSANLTIDFAAWALESKAIGCNTACAGLPPPPVTTNIALTKSYFTSSRRIARERMALAGYRLAALLNDLYGH